MIDENDLYRSIIDKKDSESLEILYDRYESLLFNLAYKITKDVQSSEEVLQDVFMKIWNQKAIFKPNKGKMSTWLITLCRNKSIDMLRKNKHIENEFDEDFQGIQNDHLPEYDLLDKEVSEEIKKMISLLNKDQQKIIYLFYYKGLSQQEIADKLQTPLGTVKSRMRLSIKHLNDYSKKHLRRERGENER
ncbi:MAG: sigma-70 family RNA polymerase sigma factor [Staphylococcus equorum]|uniref:Sigma-70 family RNA polymerase sigma factor n=1 Tax=Staphylococcus equorum TaxID=246432 RepID=A0AAW7AKP2_9STAP|nr:sigma-70 family RNA polymerase sigma factor [Staphylococcus equorum]MDG0822498.1 sigma-70 family RNA polymerase sigma factor [Staphylococcus equorum]MDG0837335.1 sigma-70 family RNA polymerase sigma factor [Staphylococcus equorum]MDK9866668.1 sigma-70 family RNA polymerase sigma factor [Staphylococcus equorum]MDK9872956.1 sigma-70 family RNA polymerase sigma factor [Staphylococcus equorum]MDK9877239.1 sigma-70 family RNA polymerase sigma factor [Staphylococcus equorum]